MKKDLKTERKVKVLVAEDDVFLAGVHKSKFTKEGFEVIMAVNGAQALELAKKNKPDIILLDLIMPVMDGFEALKCLKSDPATKSIKVVILSNLSQEEDKKRVMDLGALDYIVKSNVSFHEIITMVKKILNLQ